MHDYRWNEITDEDLVWHDHAEAKKLAYKRNETWTLFWIDDNDNLLGCSIGNYSWCAFDYKYYNMKSIMPMVRSSKGAYSIDEKFTTKFLRDKRKKDKENALALRKNEEIRNENIERYEKIIKNNKIKDGSLFASIRERFDELRRKYEEVFEEVGNAADEDFPQKLKFLSTISFEFNEALLSLDAAVYGYELEKNGNELANVNTAISNCDRDIERFYSLFTK